MRSPTDIEDWTQARLVEVGPAVVAIGARGSGVVVGEGHVLTNAHHVRGREVPVLFADGREAAGAVVAADHDADIAVVAADTGQATAPEWSDEPAAVGRPVLALARSRPSGVRATLGTVSAVGQRFRGPGGRAISGAIEHTAPLARGSSGGPLIDARGRVLGLNTNRLADGFYLALPTDADLWARVEALRAGEVPRRPRLGIGAAPSSVARRLRSSVGLPPRDGLLVRAVAEGSAAERAGLRVGDLIVGAGDEPVVGIDGLHAALDGLDDGQTLRLAVFRGTEERQVTVTFEDADEHGDG